MHQNSFVDALEKLVLGPPRTLVRSPEERERFAYQEDAHTLCGLLVRGADPVNRVQIIPRGQRLPHIPRPHDRPISIQAAVLRLPA